MKKILITGKNSYIGTALGNWLAKEPESYQVESIGMRDGSWKERDFSPYDVVFHTAGIVHIKETQKNQELYYLVNRDLAYAVAQKAKNDGVKQFIFLSSMSVYGLESGFINTLTPLKPNTNYGKSKLEAEELINQLHDESFKIAILRPPMVYGENCKGNYQKLAKFAVNTPVFPKIKNKRSMIYIDNLSECVKHLIDNKSRGLFFPQNSEYLSTSEIVRLIAEFHGNRIFMIKLFNPIISSLRFKNITKIFGNLGYEMSMSEYKFDYRVYSYKESILKTEQRD